MSAERPTSPASDGAAPLPQTPVMTTAELQEARRLLDALERDLGAVSAADSNVDVLRAELAELRRVLHADESTPEAVHTGLHGMRDRLHELQDELKGDAFQVGRYLAEIGRVLGL